MENLFLSNYSEVKFIDQLKDSLSKCKSFAFSVSFIKHAGLLLLSKDIENALIRGVSGKLITSTYQNFTDARSLETFLNWMSLYKNFECHLDKDSFGENGFHSKGYLFEMEDSYQIIIGSSNITRFALQKNIEWNLLISDNSDIQSYRTAAEEFDFLWSKTYTLSRSIINEYIIQLEYSIEKWDMDYFHLFNNITPNYMQRKALKELRRYRDQGVRKALVVAATGSGKTHLAAFDARNFGAKRILFIVHRENILIEALKTFKSIFGSNFTYGIFSGNQKEIERDFIFATNLMIQKNLYLFDIKEFDYIILDEVHHAVADTYQSIIKYFDPEFILGLTATPDRMDNLNVYDIFDKNVPFDLRLRDAIINDLIVPFEYYGIRDTLVDYDEKNIDKLIHDISKNENCEFIASEIKKHLPSGKLKAVAFCRRKDHAKRMADSMEQYGFSTMHLTGENDVGDRIRVFKDLQNENHPLEIIFTVDILNEGVDIPGINMVLFLRPTESSIVFLQQLGRGLRKYENKPYLTVLDFIGNSYKRSIQIVKALGTLTESSVIEKNLLIDLINDDFKALAIPGVRIIFDQLSKEQIVDLIRNSNFNRKDYLMNDYLNFKRYISAPSYPTHMDYLNNDFAPDLMRFMKSKIGQKNVSYYNFLKKIDEIVPDFNTQEKEFIDKLSSLLPLIRSYEYDIINFLIEHSKLTEFVLINYIEQKYGYIKEKQFFNALSNLRNLLVSDNKNSQEVPILEYDDNTKSLFFKSTNIDFSVYLKDLLDYGLTRYQEEFGDFEGDFKLYGNYSTEQIMMALCEKSYFYMKGTKIVDGYVYIMANLKKDESTQEHLKYNDLFKDDRTFQWESETNTTLKKNRGLIESKLAYLFIRKTSEEDGITLPFTYIGTGKLTNPKTSNNPKSSLIFDVQLEKSIPEYLQFDFGLKK